MSRNDLIFQLCWGPHSLQVQTNQDPVEAWRGKLAVHGVLALGPVGGGGRVRVCS